MRKETRLALGVLGLTTLGTSYLVGQNGAVTMALPAAAVQESSQVASPSSSSSATTGPSSTSTPSATDAAAAPTETATATAEPTQSASASATYTSSTVNYRYGQVQLAVTVNGNLIESIDIIKATTDGRQYQQVPPMLVDLALQAQGSNFGNISRATFTTQAFKKALDDALAQAGM